MKNEKAKINDYKKFWKRNIVKKPLIGFDIGGLFYFKRFKFLQKIKDGEIQPKQIKPKEYLSDYDSFYGKSSSVNDDLIKGVSPIAAIPWMEAIMGCPVKISAKSESIWAEERKATWAEIDNIHIDTNNPWLEKYLEFIKVLVNHANGKYPVSQPFLRGITDVMGALRGHTQAIIDCMENKSKMESLAKKYANIYIKVIKAQFSLIPEYNNGYFINNYSLWAPDKIVRLQEDAIAAYSPELFCELIKNQIEYIASSFPYSLIHLHTSSLFLIDHFLDIDSLNVIEVNIDKGNVAGMSLEDMLPYLKRIQDKDKCLIVRGALSLEETKQIKNKLSPTGLLLHVIVEDEVQAQKQYRKLKNLW